MIEKQLEVRNELGFHARVASRLVRELRPFKSSVTVNKNGKAYDLRSLSGIMLVDAKKGDILSVTFDGEDEDHAAAAVTRLFEEKFGEK